MAKLKVITKLHPVKVSLQENEKSLEFVSKEDNPSELAGEIISNDEEVSSYNFDTPEKLLEEVNKFNDRSKRTALIILREGDSGMVPLQYIMGEGSEE